MLPRGEMTERDLRTKRWKRTEYERLVDNGGELRDYLDAHPADPVLVVEVSLTSLEFDRVHKSSLYARAGRPEYWIVNLVDRVVEIRRAPAPAASTPYGWDYTTVEILSPGEDARPLAAPGTQITVPDLLP